MTTNISRIITLRLLSIFILSTFAFVSCIEEYWPELNDEYDNLLVVDGKITNEPGPYSIKLSRSSSLLETAERPLSAAVVTIIDNEGGSEILIETDLGTYTTSETGIQGVVGRMYKLVVETEGKTYESTFEQLLEPQSVEMISFKEETHILDDVHQSGYQFYISTQAVVNSNYYWEVEETYEYHAPYPTEKIYNGGPKIINNPDPYAFYYCWNTNMVKEIFTQNTEYLRTDEIHDIPLHFVTFESEKARIKYSAIAKQYTISKKAYAFIKSIQEMNSTDNQLHVRQPYQIQSNLVNTTNPNEPVLGYFLTAGISNSQHIFTPSTLISQFDAFKWSTKNCNIVFLEEQERPVAERDVLNSSPDEWPLYLNRLWCRVYPEDEYISILMVINYHQRCMDCRQNGGSTQKPDFWVD